MAFTITSLASGSIGGGGIQEGEVSSAATVTATVANNDWLVVVACKLAPWEPFTSCTDSVGNTYTSRSNGSFNDGMSDFSAQAHFRIYTAPVTTNITNGTVTASISPETTAYGQTIQVYRVRPTAGSTISVIGSGQTSGGAGLTNHTVGPVSVTSGDVIFCGASLQTNDTVTGDSDTTNGSWSTKVQITETLSAELESNVNVSQYKIVSATGNQTWTGTTSSGRASVGGHLVLRETVAVPKEIDANASSYSISGKVASLERGREVVAGTSSYAVTGTAASLERGREVLAAGGNYALTGTAAMLRRAHVPLTAVAGSYALTGNAVGLSTSSTFQIAADVGSYALTGTTAALELGREVVAGASSYAVTGTAATAKHGWKNTAGAGSYALTGSIAGLASTDNKLLILEPSSYAQTGTAATLRLGHKFVAAGSSYSLTGTSPVMLFITEAQSGSADGRPIVERRGDYPPQTDDDYRQAKLRRERRAYRDQLRLRRQILAGLEGIEYVDLPDRDPEDPIVTANLAQALASPLLGQISFMTTQLADVKNRRMIMQQAQQQQMREAADDEDDAAAL